MIPLTRLNGDHIAINPDRIERADVTPDVVLTMTDGSKYVIAESLDELIDRIRSFRASIVALSQELMLRGEAGRSSPLRLIHEDLTHVVTDAVAHHAIDTYPTPAATGALGHRTGEGPSGDGPPDTAISNPST